MADKYPVWPLTPGGFEKGRNKVQSIRCFFKNSHLFFASSLNPSVSVGPTLLSPVIQNQLDQWDPLGDLATSKTVVDSIFNLNLNSSSPSTSHDRQDKEALRSLRYSIIRNQLKGTFG